MRAARSGEDETRKEAVRAAQERHILLEKQGVSTSYPTQSHFAEHRALIDFGGMALVREEETGKMRVL